MKKLIMKLLLVTFACFSFQVKADINFSEGAQDLFKEFVQGMGNNLRFMDIDSSVSEKTKDFMRDLYSTAFKTGVGVLKMQQEAAVQEKLQKARVILENQGALERTQAVIKAMTEFLSDPVKLRQLGIVSLGVGGGLIATYYGCQLAYEYIKKGLFTPTLIRETSRKGMTQAYLKYPKRYLPAVFGQEIKEKNLNLDEIILAPDLKTRIEEVADITQKTTKLGLPRQHVLLHGKPGVGKSMFARILSKMSGVDYAIMSGADFNQFKEGDDIKALHDLFDWAEKSPNGLILFIDECESFLKNRSLADDRTIRLLDAFLSRTGTSGDKVMFVFATNHPEMIDSAALSRISYKIHFPLPGMTERVGILNLYLKKFIVDKTLAITLDGEKQDINFIVDADINDDFINQVAEKIDGFSGRDIEKMVMKIQSKVCLHPDFTLEKKLFEAVLEETLQDHESVCKSHSNGRDVITSGLPVCGGYPLTKEPLINDMNVAASAG